MPFVKIKQIAEFRDTYHGKMRYDGKLVIPLRQGFDKPPVHNVMAPGISREHREQARRVRLRRNTHQHQPPTIQPRLHFAAARLDVTRAVADTTALCPPRTTR